MSKRKMNRKKLRVINGKKLPSPPANHSEDLPTVNASAHGQRTQPTDPAEITAALFFWPLDVMRWWMPRTGA